MKNLFFIGVSLLLLIVASCAKKAEEQLLDLVKISTEGVHLEDGYLVFDNQAAFDRIFEQIKDAPKESLDAWEEKLGFKSVRGYFDAYKSALCGVENEDIINEINQGYIGLVKFESEGTTRPLFGGYYMGTVMNKDGEFKIEKNFIKFTDRYSITIINGDREKMNHAIQHPETNPEVGVFVVDRGEDGDVRANCAGSNGGENLAMDYEDNPERKMMNKLYINNQSFYGGGSFWQNNMLYIERYALKYEVHTDIEYKKKNFLSWGCDRKHFRWGRTLSLYHNFNSSPSLVQGIYPNPIQSNVNTFVTGYECYYDHFTLPVDKTVLVYNWSTIDYHNSNAMKITDVGPLSQPVRSFVNATQANANTFYPSDECESTLICQ